MSSKLIFLSKSVSILRINKKKSNQFRSIDALQNFLINFSRKNECSGEHFITVSVKNMRKAISIFGKAHSTLISVITLYNSAYVSFVFRLFIDVNL